MNNFQKVIYLLKVTMFKLDCFLPLNGQSNHTCRDDGPRLRRDLRLRGLLGEAEGADGASTEAVQG